MAEDPKAAVRRWYDVVLNGRQLDRVEEFWADERLVEPVRRGCLTYLEAFPDLHCSIEELVAEGETVFCRSTMTGSQDGEYKGIPPTGRHVSAESAEVFRVVDGRFAGYWCLADVAGLMRQLTTEPVPAVPAG